MNPTTYYYLKEDENFIDAAKNLILLKLKHEKLIEIPINSSSSITLSSTNSEKQALIAIEPFLTNCEASFSSSSSHISVIKSFTIQQELGFYISSIEKETEFENFWKLHQQKLPILANLARFYCMMPITSVASESAFFVAGYVQRKTRSSLLPTTLRYLMLLRDYKL